MKLAVDYEANVDWWGMRDRQLVGEFVAFIENSPWELILVLWKEGIVDVNFSEVLVKGHSSAEPKTDLALNQFLWLDVRRKATFVEVESPKPVLPKLNPRFLDLFFSQRT